jgi:hypothetical protein
MTASGWGKATWGSSPWGSDEALPPSPPVITPLDPVNNDAGIAQLRPLSIRLTDDTGIAPAKTMISVNGVIWVLGGSPVNGATLESAVNSGHGFDLVVTPPEPYDFGSNQQVTVSATDVDGNTTVLVYTFSVGIGLRLLAARNPFEGTLLAYFNQPMLIDDHFLSPGDWVVTPISAGATPLAIEAVMAQTGQANVANLQYTGGTDGATYLLTVSDLFSATGVGLETGFNTATFVLAFATQQDPTIHLFNSIFGPLGVSQRVITRRVLDNHVANRSLAVALNEQFRLRAQGLDGTANSSGKPGSGRL